jgi:aminopeptidase N
VPLDRALKLNIDGTGNYRVQYDAGSWKLLLEKLPSLSAPDRVNLLSDSWAIVQANRAHLSLYFGLIEKLPPTAELAEREQIMNAFDYINRLIAGNDRRASFQRYARSILRPIFDQVGWEPKKGEQLKSATLRADLINTLGDLDDQEIVAGCRERFQKFFANPVSVPPDLRPPILNVVGRYADDATWSKLHELGLKTTSFEEKQNYYDALARATHPKLVKRALQIALTEELPTSRALYMVPRVARESEHPEIAWQFAQAHMKGLLAKADALGVNRYAPSLFTFFSETGRIGELQAYAKKNLPPGSAQAVAQAIEEIGFRSEFKQRLLPQLIAWTTKNESNSSTPVPAKLAASLSDR